jgi:hypothetical protein
MPSPDLTAPKVLRRRERPVVIMRPPFDSSALRRRYASTEPDHSTRPSDRPNERFARRSVWTMRTRSTIGWRAKAFSIPAAT